MKRLILLAVLTSLSLGQTAGDSVRVYTLDECIAVALRDNPTLAREQKNIEIGQSALTRAFGAYLPSLGASAGYSRQLNVEGGRAVNIGGQVFVLGPPEPNSYSLSAVASYLLFNGFDGVNHSGSCAFLPRTDLSDAFTQALFELLDAQICAEAEIVHRVLHDSIDDRVDALAARCTFRWTV